MIKKLFYIVFVFLLIPSCNEYQKLLRSEDFKIKYQMAENYFENENLEERVVYLNKYYPNTEANLKQKE